MQLFATYSYNLFTFYNSKSIVQPFVQFFRTKSHNLKVTLKDLSLFAVTHIAALQICMPQNAWSFLFTPAAAADKAVATAILSRDTLKRV
jgi:hypothetical protein